MPTSKSITALVPPSRYTVVGSLPAEKDALGRWVSAQELDNWLAGVLGLADLFEIVTALRDCRKITGRS